MSSNYTLCVVGASGHLGAHVVKQALQKGWKGGEPDRVHGAFQNAQQQAKGDWLMKLPNAQDNLKLFSGDLDTPGSFSEALRGCDGAIMGELPDNPKVPELIDTVRGGTDHFLRSCTEHKINTVVITSSGASTNPKEGEPEVKNELLHWSDPEQQISEGKYAYAAKTLMERSAFKYAEEHPEMKLVIMNPNGILGVELSPDTPMLYRVIKGQILTKIPNATMSVIDVRDLAALELVALRKEDAKGRYFAILKSFHWQEFFESIQRACPDYKLPPKGYGADEAEASITRYDKTRQESLGVKLRDLDTLFKDIVDDLKKRNLL